MGLPGGMLDEQVAAIAEAMAEDGEDRLPVGLLHRARTGSRTSRRPVYR